MATAGATDTLYFIVCVIFVVDFQPDVSSIKICLIYFDFAVIIRSRHINAGQ